MEKEIKEIKLIQNRNFYLIIFCIGMILNMFVFSANGYLMPVKSEREYNFNNNKHFTYQNNSEVKLWLLTDWLFIKIKNNIIYFSIGDLIILVSILTLIYNTISLLKLNNSKKNK